MGTSATVPEVSLRPITAVEYYRMGEVGILGPDERIELLNGRIVSMPPIGPRHAHVVRMLSRIFETTLAGRAVVSAQLPVDLDGVSQPQPDVVLARTPAARYAVAHPTAQEVHLVVEVSETTLRYDAGEKLAAYARSGIPEYWIVDLTNGRVDAYTEPAAEGYRVRRTAVRGEALAPCAFAELVVAVDELLAGKASPE